MYHISLHLRFCLPQVVIWFWDLSSDSFSLNFLFAGLSRCWGLEHTIATHGREVFLTHKIKVTFSQINEVNIPSSEGRTTQIKSHQKGKKQTPNFTGSQVPGPNSRGVAASKLVTFAKKSKCPSSYPGWVRQGLSEDMVQSLLLLSKVWNEVGHFF